MVHIICFYKQSFNFTLLEIIHKKSVTYIDMEVTMARQIESPHLDKCFDTEQEKASKKIEIGEYVYFATFENKQILWRVINIDKKGNPMLWSWRSLTSRDFDEYEGNNWKTSSIRKWLNDEKEGFLKDFQTGDRNIVIEGPDKVFLLSEKEYKNCVRRRWNSEFTDQFWLRTPYASYTGHVRCVNSRGGIYFVACYDCKGVQPALYVRMSSVISKTGMGTAQDPYVIKGK